MFYNPAIQELETYSEPYQIAIRGRFVKNLE